MPREGTQGVLNAAVLFQLFQVLVAHNLARKESKTIIQMIAEHLHGHL